MATSKKGKKVVNQEELRRLMREKQRQATDKKRVESPFAKYNSLGHLSCVLCNVQVKSELLWPAHVLGKQHKEKVAELKGANSQPAAVKRRAPDSEDVNGEKRVKPAPVAGQSAGFSGRAAASTQKSAGLNLLAGGYDDDDEEEGEGAAAGPPAAAEPANPAPPNKEAEAAGLPEDFFDSSVPSHSGSILKAEVAEKKKKAPGDSKTAEALPEGFFDDPVTDAKVRNVDAPQDQMDREWEEFQREIRQVNTKSEAIVAEDDEEGRLERQIDEIDEQIECYRRVEVLRDRRDTVKSKPLSNKGGHMEVDASDDDEEEDEEELLGLLSRDWRAKGALA